MTLNATIINKMVNHKQDKFNQNEKKTFKDKVNFVFLKEHKFKRSYVFSLLKEDIIKRSSQIAEELSKIGGSDYGR